MNPSHLSMSALAGGMCEFAKGRDFRIVFVSEHEHSEGKGERESLVLSQTLTQNHIFFLFNFDGFW